jgi:hypothetical protein
MIEIMRSKRGPYPLFFTNSPTPPPTTTMDNHNESTMETANITTTVEISKEPTMEASSKPSMETFNESAAVESSNESTMETFNAFTLKSSNESTVNSSNESTVETASATSGTMSQIKRARIEMWQIEVQILAFIAMEIPRLERESVDKSVDESIYVSTEVQGILAAIFEKIGAEQETVETFIIQGDDDEENEAYLEAYRRYRTMEAAANRLQKESKGYLDSLRGIFRQIDLLGRR